MSADNLIREACVGHGIDYNRYLKTWEVFQNITPLNYPELREYRLLARATFILLFAASSLCSIYLDLKNRVRKQIGNYSS